ncbi:MULTISPECIES: hypothetical protein [Paenibacillus]|jgi:hypothetical protein|uniref:Uncharacterized protein n=1 Tax=Paenibacillus oceani TaxID=2772510 RepID=A0A927C8Y8_9BACL|nr:hypothetical protein [Paenibacillus oceani]MBD2862257.1 hypothetical protein [Paenibacillus oceani]MDF2657576.1 hypothetical protein [Paenibacillus sp.]
MVVKLVISLIIFAVLNGILVWELLWSAEPMSGKVRKRFFAAVNAAALLASLAVFIWFEL